MKNTLTVLHFASLDNNACSGVNAVVPKYIDEQKKFIDVKLVNVNDEGCDSAWQSLNPNLVVFQEAHVFKYIKIYKKLKKEGIPYIIVPHGELTKFCQKQKFLKKKISDLLFFNRFFKNASAFHYLSENEKNMTKNYADYFIVSNGIEKREEAKPKVTIGDRIVFSFIGRFDVYIKGLDLLFETVSQNKDILQNKCVFNLYGVADKKNEHRLNKLKKKYDCAQLIFINDPVFGKEKDEIYKNTDVYFQLSRTEANPTSVLEALSFGVPCLVSNTTGMGKIINENNSGWNCDLNVRSILECLCNIISEKEKILKMSYNSLKLANEKYSWEKVTMNVIEHYEKIKKGK